MEAAPMIAYRSLLAAFLASAAPGGVLRSLTENP
jgi:hypothetical protein